MIETRNLTKTFDDFTAVDSLNLTIETGEFFGLLGPNGAGKTTTISLLSTLLASHKRGDPDRWPDTEEKPSGSETQDQRDHSGVFHAPGYDHGRDHGISGKALFHAPQGDPGANRRNFWSSVTCLNSVSVPSANFPAV